MGGKGKGEGKRYRAVPASHPDNISHNVARSIIGLHRRDVSTQIEERMSNTGVLRCFKTGFYAITDLAHHLGLGHEEVEEAVVSPEQECFFGCHSDPHDLDDVLAIGIGCRREGYGFTLFADTEKVRDYGKCGIHPRTDGDRR